MTKSNFYYLLPNYALDRLVLVCALLFSAFYTHAQNILISDKNKPNEPSIMMNPKNPAQLIAAANINNYFVSNDTGRTWTNHTLTSSYGVWGDPVISVDTAGIFYFFHLSNPPAGNWIDRIVCQKTKNMGQTWNDGSFTGLNGTKAQDKQWCDIDRINNNLYLTWTQFDAYGDKSPTCYSAILFSKSQDQGETWTPAIKINRVDGDCIDSDNTVEGAVPAVGPDGQIYVSWAGPKGLVFNKSTDYGQTWLKEEINIDPFPSGWDYNIPGIIRANGLPVTVCDRSQSPYRGTIYVNWSDQRNGANDTDVWLSKSNDGGQTWSSPRRVNTDPPGKHQFLTWMTLDQTNGNLYFIFYDRRNYTDNTTDVYMAISNDGGETFINRRLSETPFIPSQNIFFGDYTNIVAHNNIIRPIWTRLENGLLSVWTDITPIGKLTATADPEPNTLENKFSSYPNPSNEVAYVSFKLNTSAHTLLEVYSFDGRKIKTVIDNEWRPLGKYIESIDFSGFAAPEGPYLIKLTINGKSKIQKHIFTK
jgi:hypothetical protein